MAMQIPLVVALWEHAGFGGRKRVIVENTPSLVLQAFNDKVSAIGVHRGPDYDAWKNAHGKQEPTVGFYQHINYGGAVLILPAGEYGNIHLLYNFGDVISSVKFNVTPPQTHPIQPIPLVVELYESVNYSGRRAVMVQDVPNIISYLGSEFNDITTSVRVKKGPNYTAGIKAELYRDVNYMGGSIQLDPGDYPNIGVSHGFNDVVSGIRFK